jgi:hypothetical protein
MSGEPGRKKQRRQQASLRGVSAAALRRIDSWQHSDLVRRLHAGDVINRGLLFAAVLLLCFVPFLLVIESLAGRTDASGFVRRFGLTGEAARAVRQALTSPSAT